MRRFLRGVFQPEIYHGFGRRPPYFEGWYFKLVDASRGQRWAIIPGIFKAEDTSTNHAFVQVLDGINGNATYHQYPADAFWAHPRRFEVRVGDNNFSADHVELDIDDVDRRIQGKVEFQSCVSLPASPLQPGIMGPFSYIPAMECYHGLVSLDHTLRGELNIDNTSVDFSGGQGYTEKDWGTNFPSAYIWQQSNHFSAPGTSLSGSVARIPLWGLNFPGFIIALWHRGKHYRWATYTRAVIDDLHVSDDHVKWVVSDRYTRLTMITERKAGGLLKAPLRTEMHKRVDETMQSKVHVRLETRDGDVLLDDCGDCTSLEVYGEIDRLVTQ